MTTPTDYKPIEEYPPEVIEGCVKCHRLTELWKATKQTTYDYWVMTELFVMLHGSDVCDGK